MTAPGRRRIYLMRHGHVDYFDPAITDPRQVSLTEEGRRQAQACRDALRHIAFDLALFSGLPRTRETGEIVLAAHGKEAPALVVEPGLEELKSGWIKAETREELAARLAFCFDDAASEGARFLPDGEKFVDAEARVVRAIEETVLKRAWRTALIVAHEGVNRLILGWACGGGLKSVAAFEQDLACVNIIDVDVTPAQAGGGLQIERALLKAVNVTPYDYVKGGLPRTSLEHLFEVDFGGVRPKTGVAR
jgi:broad specificity phosphatase PhoE